MDPLTALGLASNIVQFVDFGLKLYKNSAEIAHSVHGTTEQINDLGTVSSKLKTFSSNLAGGSSLLPTNEASDSDEGYKAHLAAIKPHVTEIQEVAKNCQDVCDKLSKAVNKLSVDDKASKRRLRAPGVALKAALSSKKLAGLKKQLEQYQNLLSVHFFPLIYARQSYMTQVLDKMRMQNEGLLIKQSSQLGKLSNTLQEILAKINMLSCKSGNQPGSVPLRAPSANEQRLQPQDVEGLMDILKELSLADKDLASTVENQHLLRSLHFPMRTHRQEAIEEAHKETFSWIFSDWPCCHLPDGAQAVETPKTFVDWLASGRGTFWISGKAGSGKSTLMKFIVDHPNTQKALSTWAGTKPAVVASHYFWSAGTEMQKDLKGLFQELLYHILCHCPELGRDLFPQQWQKLQKRVSTSGQVGWLDDIWTVRELQEGLLKMARHPTLPVRCCVFIDGLDEYSQGHQEMCDLLQKLTTPGNFKCCVSSRPYNVFEDAFGSRSRGRSCAPYLRVHELTYDDIDRFTRSRLQDIERWHEMGINEYQIEQLACTITERAEGVFLWVLLVTKSLRDGVTDGDTFADLQRRLEAVPTELEACFRQMLDRVDAIHHRYMAQILLLALNAKRRLDPIVCDAVQYELDDAGHARSQHLPCDDIWSSKNWTTFLESCSRRINARSGGLLHIVYPNRLQRYWASPAKVEFIHRTVYDFLHTGAMQDYLEQRAPQGFQPQLSILRALLFLFRGAGAAETKTANVDDFLVRWLWEEFLKNAPHSMDEDKDATIRLLEGPVHELQEAYAKNNGLWSVIREVCNGNDLALTARIWFTAPPEESMTPKASPGLLHTYLSADLDTYILDKLKRDVHCFDAPGLSVLGTLMHNENVWTEARVESVRLLLESGCDPNETVYYRRKICSSWSLFCDRGLDAFFIPRGIFRSLVNLLLQHWASRESLGYLVDGKYPLTHFIEGLHWRYEDKLEAVDVFLNASPEVNRMQLEKIFGWCVLKKARDNPKKRLARVTLFEKLILLAIELRLPKYKLFPHDYDFGDYFPSPRPACLDFLDAHGLSERSFSSDVLTKLENHMNSVLVLARAWDPKIWRDESDKYEELIQQSVRKQREDADFVWR